MGRFQNTDGTWMALGLVGALALSSRIRRGSGYHYFGCPRCGKLEDKCRCKTKGSAARNDDLVVNAWVSGQVAPAPKGLWTDGTRLWSYALMIGDTDEQGRKVVYDHRGRSATTNRHLSAARRQADLVIDPNVRTLLD